MILELWIISGLLSLLYFIRISKYYPDMFQCSGISEMDIGDLFVMIAVVMSGFITFTFTLFILFLKFK